MSEGLGTKLRRLLAALDGEVEAVYDELGVAFRPRFHPIVRRLLDSPGCSVTAIAEAAGVSQPAATQTINEMRRLGLVETMPGTDRRAKLIRLSPDGRELARKLAPVWEATHAAAAALDAELPASLDETVEAAMAALRRQSFGARIRSRMEEG